MRGSASWISLLFVLAVIVPLVWMWLRERAEITEDTTVRCRQRDNKLVRVQVRRDRATLQPLAILGCSDETPLRCNRACLPLLMRTKRA
jgi:hypothetical protein